MIKLRNFLKSKTFYIIVSALLGVMTWLLVLNYTNPTEKRSLDIPLNVLNGNAPAALGLSERDSSVPDKITIKASGRSDIIGNLTAADLYAFVDFAEIDKAGTTTLKIDEPECKRLGIKIEDYYPKKVDVMYDKMSHVNVDVIVDYDNSLLAENFEILSVKAEPSTVQISGFESDIADIDCIKVKLNESLAAGSIDSDRIGSYLGHYYLKSGEEVTADYEKEKISVQIEVAKRVPLKFSVSGEPHNDYYLGKTSINSNTVLLRGASSALRNINEIDLGSIDVSGATGNVIKNFNIESYLPAGIATYQTAEVSVSAEILKYEIKNITVNMSDSVSTPGKNPREYTYEFSKNQFDVKIKGKAADLANLSVSSLGPEIDLTDKGVGEYILPLEFTAIDNAKYTVIGDYTCSVKIADKIEETPAPSTPSPESTATATATP
ncbi:MAG: hypothetical protein E7387_00805 [Ruminococcaceae bacterium]|nr:hypothetical protein [Oscillospiraceae bacterium]